jgi:hypothetical protein
VPNLIAWAALWSWPLITLILFQRLRPAQALVWSILGGYLLLPEKVGINVPLLPSFNKTSVVAVSALLGCLVAHPARSERAEPSSRRTWLPQGAVARLLLGLLLVMPIVATLANGDRIAAGGRVIPGLRFYDAGAFFYAQVFAVLPFLLVRRYLGDQDHGRLMLHAVALAVLAYTLPIIVELVMSPQVNRWVYGFYQFRWLQQLRGGAYRPVVFLNHGLWTALVVALGFVAAAGAWRVARQQQRLLWAAATVWTGIVLAGINSFGAQLIGLLFAPLARLAGSRMQILTAALIGGLILAYPMLRGVGWVPTGPILSAVARIDAGRASSLQFRFVNEDLLLSRANERPLTGWGGWGRSRVYDETGRDIAATDGRWIIVFGFYGWLGYLAEYGLLTLPLFAAARRWWRTPPDPATAVLCLVLAANLVDTIPNATVTPITWMLAGAVLAQVERSRLPAAVADDARPTRPRGLRVAVGAVHSHRTPSKT